MEINNIPQQYIVNHNNAILGIINKNGICKSIKYNLEIAQIISMINNIKPFVYFEQTRWLADKIKKEKDLYDYLKNKKVKILMVNSKIFKNDGLIWIEEHARLKAENMRRPNIDYATMTSHSNGFTAVLVY